MFSSHAVSSMFATCFRVTGFRWNFLPSNINRICFHLFFVPLFTIASSPVSGLAVAQPHSHLWDLRDETPQTAAHQASPSIANSWSLLKLVSIESVMPSSGPVLCHPLPLLSAIFPSIRNFSNELAPPIRWPKYWTFSFSISASNEYSGLISFRTDRFDLFAVQETLNSLLQHHSSKVSTLRCSVFFMVQLSYPYVTTGKTIALTRWTFVGKVMSLLFNMLSRLVITFLPRSKHLLVSWLRSPSAVTMETTKRKSVPVSILSPSICQEVMGPDAIIFVIWMLNFKPAFSLSSFTFIKRL